jgi:hypothetical protein
MPLHPHRNEARSHTGPAQRHGLRGRLRRLMQRTSSVDDSFVAAFGWRRP